MHKDFFENCIYIDSEVKDIMNARLEKYMNAICVILEKSGIDSNLCLTGSLSRKEPAILHDGTSYMLSSDLDFVLIINEASEKKAYDVISKIKNLNRNYDASFCIIEKKNVNKVMSNFGRDLSLSISNPIYRSFSLDPITIALEDQDYYEAIVNQLACYFLHPQVNSVPYKSITFRNQEYHYLKLLLECARAQRRDNRYIGYYNLVDGDFSDIGIRNINNIIRKRELSTNEDISVGIDLYSTLWKSLDFYFRSNLTDEKYCMKYFTDIVYEKYRTSEKDNITCFQTILILFVFSFCKVENMNRNIMLEIIKRIFPDLIISNISNFEFINMLREYRIEYINFIHNRNTTEKRWDEIYEL